VLGIATRVRPPGLTRGEGEGVEVSVDELRSSIALLPDSELLRIVGVDSSEYRPDALECARQELARRNVPIPDAGGAASLPDAFDQGAPTAQSTRKDPFAGMSPLTRLLLAASIGFAGFARLGRMSSAPVRIHPAWGVATVSALLWSLAWDARAKSSEPVAGVLQEPKWPARLVILAMLSTAATVYVMVHGSLW